MFITNILKTLDIEKIDSLIKDGYIIRNVHPSGDLFIYNYSQKAMYEGYWTDETLQCRGLIADKEGNIVARPFPKFFNLEQHQGQIPLEPFEVYEKLDGSLGILYFYKNKPYIATRGSFDSEQAKVANDMLKTFYKNSLRHLNKEFTYLFEIIYPENRIVVNYGDQRSLTLLTVISTHCGREFGPKNINPFDCYPDHEFPVVKQYDGLKDINEIAALNIPNQEGFVIRLSDVRGTRIKIKFKDYVRLHSIVTQITKRKVWEVIKDNKNFDEFIGNIPDELFGWIKATESDLRKEYQKIEEEAKLELKKIIAPYRKDIAMQIKDHPQASVMFSMLDNKDSSKVIWSILEPEHEIPVIEGLGVNRDEE